MVQIIDFGPAVNRQPGFRRGTRRADLHTTRQSKKQRHQHKPMKECYASKHMKVGHKKKMRHKISQSQPPRDSIMDNNMVEPQKLHHFLTDAENLNGKQNINSIRKRMLKYKACDVANQKS